jgi:hypothetical protein
LTIECTGGYKRLSLLRKLKSRPGKSSCEKHFSCGKSIFIYVPPFTFFHSALIEEALTSLATRTNFAIHIMAH